MMFVSNWHFSAFLSFQSLSSVSSFLCSLPGKVAGASNAQECINFAITRSRTSSPVTINKCFKVTLMCSMEESLRGGLGFSQNIYKTQDLNTWALQQCSLDNYTSPGFQEVVSGRLFPVPVSKLFLFKRNTSTAQIPLLIWQQSSNASFHHACLVGERLGTHQNLESEYAPAWQASIWAVLPPLQGSSVANLWRFVAILATFALLPKVLVSNPVTSFEIFAKREAFGPKICEKCRPPFYSPILCQNLLCSSINTSTSIWSMTI